jgi:glycerophosphoryl diester phosphodiesterase
MLDVPVLTWTVRTPAQQERAARWADQMIFEGFRP